MKKHVQGKVVYIDLEGGFWGIETKEENFLPMNFPEQLKIQDKLITCSLDLLEDTFTMQNWGLPCLISSFTT